MLLIFNNSLKSLYNKILTIACDLGEHQTDPISGIIKLTYTHGKMTMVFSRKMVDVRINGERILQIHKDESYGYGGGFIPGVSRGCIEKIINIINEIYKSKVEPKILEAKQKQDRREADHCNKLNQLCQEL